MSHFGVQSNRSDEFPSRSMSRLENIEFNEKLNSSFIDFSPSSSVTSESDASDIPPPPPPPLEDDTDCSSDYDDETYHCINFSDSNSQTISDQNDTVKSMCRNSATIVVNENLNSDTTRDDCHGSNDESSHRCTAKRESGVRIQARTSTCCTGEFKCSSKNGSNYNQQIDVACDEGDDDIDANCDHCNVECEHEDYSYVIHSTCRRSKCKNSTNDGRIDTNNTIASFDSMNNCDKIINSSSVGWRHTDRSHTNFAAIDNGTDDVSSLIESDIPLESEHLVDTNLCSNRPSLHLSAVRPKYHFDPPILSEDGNGGGHNMNHTLRACFLILNVFALRCSFDHWRRKTKHEEQSASSLFDPLSFEQGHNTGILSLVSSNQNSSSSILSLDAFSISSLRIRRRPISSPFHVSSSIRIQYRHRYHSLTFHVRSPLCISGDDKSKLTRESAMLLSG
jgi:hypothetical protein